jgi:hypothetical protein
MVARSKYVLSQFGPLSENCALLVNGYVVRGTAITVARRSPQHSSAASAEAAAAVDFEHRLGIWKSVNVPGMVVSNLAFACLRQRTGACEPFLLTSTQTIQIWSLVASMSCCSSAP